MCVLCFVNDLGLLICCGSVVIMPLQPQTYLVLILQVANVESTLLTDFVIMCIYSMMDAVK